MIEYNPRKAKKYPVATRLISLRLPGDLIDRIDLAAEKASTPASKVSRTEAIVMLLQRRVSK